LGGGERLGTAIRGKNGLLVKGHSIERNQLGGKLVWGRGLVVGGKRTGGKYDPKKK